MSLVFNDEELRNLEHKITDLYVFGLNWLTQFLFSAHISYGKGKYLNQTGFFYKICQELLFT